MPNLSRLKPLFSTLTARKPSLLTPLAQWLRTNTPALFGDSSTATRIARADCLYRCFDLRDIPNSARRSALQLKINQYSPWPSPKTNVVWQHHAAQVWCWPADDTTSQQQCVVESRYFPRPDHDSTQLLACEPGYEAQYWQDGVLKESHWWQEQPSLNAWQNFQRAAGLAVTDTLPTSMTTQNAQAWGKDYKLDQNAVFMVAETRFWQALPLIVAFVLSWQLTQIYKLHQDIAAQQQQQSELSQKIEPILQMRKTIQDDQQFLTQVAGVWQGPRQLQLLNQVLAKLPDPARNKMLFWEYQADQMRFTIQTDNADPSLFVKTYTDLGLGKEVSAEPDSKTGQITVTIRFQADAEH